MKIGDTTLF